MLRIISSSVIAMLLKTLPFEIGPLTPELTQFVTQFDAGKLPEFEGEIEAAEKVRLDSLSGRLWNLTMEGLERLRGVNHQSI